ncbi:MAG: DegT/DnrJ/EryC1/StrS family aminotransferase [Candidatus Endonucleobacter bathymodioli]|uniref:DegT/DnrJ/EryC1/StrS family aminotransferase n=1 Tax=Candidatus Endonucleibacter bathymodioli TaxID=539814 RepID=A0AA90NU20_9GAMM|nr:DegT/DnrJ/EryC1/StrS family aminotransferase [Candidatus Endonucleobacter bathymodioli]
MEFIDLRTQYQSLKQRIDHRIHAVLDHGQYIFGPEVFELEEQLAEYVGAKHCISCANGTDALNLALMVMGVGEGDAIFCPTFTFFAPAESIALKKATPIFCDVNEHTFTICADNLEQQIQSVRKEGKLTPKAIMAVDLFGLPANYPAIRKLCDRYNLLLIEDGAQGFGGSIADKKACSFGDISTTSFFPAKPLGCYGDGGALFTDNDGYADRLKSLRVHGKGNNKYDNVRLGVNSRLDTIQAAILLEKLAVFPQELLDRNELAQFYTDNLKSIELPIVPEGYYSSWAQYTIKSGDRDELMTQWLAAGVPSAVYYAKCMHKQSAFSDFDDQKFAVADGLVKRVLSLPMSGYVKTEDAQKVVKISAELAL